MKKALLEIGGKPLVERVLEATRPLSDESIVVDNDDSLAHLPGIRIVPDVETRAGVLTALYSGLSSAKKELCLVVACDMPFLNSQLLRWMVGVAAGFDVVAPVVEGRMDPMHALYRREPCLEAIGRALARGEKRMISYLGEVRVREVTETELRSFDPELRSLFNINTPEDLEWARGEAVTRGSGRGDAVRGYGEASAPSGLHLLQGSLHFRQDLRLGVQHVPVHFTQALAQIGS